MYDFADETPDYVTESMFNQRQPEVDWHKHHMRETPRMVHPHGIADDSLLGFFCEELEEGWDTAQMAQLIGAVFMEMFDTTAPDYFVIYRAAKEWQVNLMRAWQGDPNEYARHNMARLLLNGVADAAERGMNGIPTGWSPRRIGHNSGLIPDTTQLSKPGRWYEAKGLDGSTWRCRKRGDVVEAEGLGNKWGHRELTPRQAKQSLTVIGLHEPADMAA